MLQIMVGRALQILDGESETRENWRRYVNKDGRLRKMAMGKGLQMNMVTVM